MTPESTLGEYYEVLERGEPLSPFFAQRQAVDGEWRFVGMHVSVGVPVESGPDETGKPSQDRPDGRVV
ncbi:MAG: hypothetical protein V5A46_02165 [Haloferacaceae archaeon]